MDEARRAMRVEIARFVGEGGRGAGVERLALGAGMKEGVVQGE